DRRKIRIPPRRCAVDEPTEPQPPPKRRVRAPLWCLILCVAALAALVGLALTPAYAWIEIAFKIKTPSDEVRFALDIDGAGYAKAVAEDTTKGKQTAELPDRLPEDARPEGWWISAGAWACAAVVLAAGVMAAINLRGPFHVRGVRALLAVGLG